MKCQECNIEMEVVGASHTPTGTTNFCSGCGWTEDDESQDMPPLFCEIHNELRKQMKSFMKENFIHPTRNDYLIIQTAMTLGSVIGVTATRKNYGSN